MSQHTLNCLARSSSTAPVGRSSRCSTVRVHAATTGGRTGGMRQLSVPTSPSQIATTPVSTSTSASVPPPVVLTPVTTTTSGPTVAVAAVRPSYRVSFFEAMRFNGPAPELINGRLAMVGLLAAAVQEAETGQTVLHQLNHVSLGTCLTLAVWVYASMVPILKGVKQEAFGPFSPRAELANGRAAMLGFAVLMGLELAAGVPFF